METVIAVGVIAFVVPLILAATGNATKSRRNSEAETRSAWIANDVQRKLTEVWRDIPHDEFSSPPSFPDFSSQASPLILHYDNNGDFVEIGDLSVFVTRTKNSRSVYFVTLYGNGQDPQNFTYKSVKQLSNVTIEVHFPSQAPQGKRHTSSYNVMIPRQKQP